jgi:integrase
MQTTKKKTSGSVGIEVKGNKLRLRLPRLVASDSRRYIHTRLDNTAENRKRLQVIAWDIETDIRSGVIADTIELHIASFKPSLIPVEKLSPPATKAITLTTLWVQYCDYKKPQLAATTYQQDYCNRWANHITKLPQDLAQGVAIRDALLATVSLNTAKRLLTLLSACGKWAVKSGLIAVNPFEGMSKEIRQPKDSPFIDPFTLAERDAILAAFQKHRHHRHYYPFVRFLFLTGCRTGEAIALQWKHISPDLTTITFAESYNSRLDIRKATKTGKVRKFPCNTDLQTLLASIRPIDVAPDALVFNSPNGLPINNSKFTNHVWRGCKSGRKNYKGILTQLVADGSLSGYRCLYNTRHTFITLMLSNGLTIPQVAKLVGNSPEVVLRHYAGDAIESVPII